MYEARVAELEANAVDFCRTSLHLQAVQSLLAAEQKKSTDLKRALTAYQCGAGSIGGSGGHSVSDDEAEDTRKETAAQELQTILAKFNFDAAAEQSMSASGIGRSMSSPHPRMSESSGSIGSSPASPAAKAVDDAQQTIQQLKLTIQGMKAAITSIHNQKTELQGQCDRLQGDVSKLQMQFTSCRRQLDDERSKRLEERDALKRELSDQRMRNQELESHSQMQVLRLEEKYSKENATLQKQVETNGREVERLKMFEERYSEMSKQCREAKEALKAAERSCEEGLAHTSLRYQSLVFHMRTKFYEWHELMHHALPPSDTLASVGGERAKLPKPDPVLADGRKVLPLKQLDEPILQQDMVLFSKIYPYCLEW
jgi:chromosome segregation ATPase